MSREIHKTLALDQELLNSVRLIRAGFGQLQNIDGANDFYHLPILTLANGFERLMKVILCFRALEASGQYPSSKVIPSGRQGHDLEFLLGKVKEECFLDGYVENIQVASEDLEFLRSDELAQFIGVLSSFGQSARYYFFDVVVGREPATDDPEAAWRRLETSILLSREDLVTMLDGEDRSKVGEIVRSIIVGKLEKLARALSRLFTIGQIGEEAQRYAGYISGFLHLRDDQFGQTQYDPCGRWL
ncbi:hypothetical protein ACOSZC_00490 [Marinobacter salsuginis]